MSLHSMAGSRRWPGSRAEFCLLPILLAFTGCAHSPARTMARVWEDLPKVRWSLPLHSDTEEPDDEEIAATFDEDGEPEDVGRARVTFFPAEPNSEPVAEQFLLASRRSGIPHDPFLEEELARQNPGPANESHDDEAESDAASHRERLRAALTVDTRRSRTPHVHTAQHDRLQLRVESLMERTRYHLERSELAEAQRAAELAHKLVENSELEFAPDDERPIDLLTTIAERLRPKADEPSSESQLAVKPPKAETGAKPADDAPPASQPAADFDPYARHVAVQAPKFQRRSSLETSFVVLEEPSFEDPAVNPTAYTAAAAEEAPAKRLLAPRRANRTEDELDDATTPPELVPAPLVALPPPASEPANETLAMRLDGPAPGSAADDDIAFDDEDDEPPALRHFAASSGTYHRLRYSTGWPPFWSTNVGALASLNDGAPDVGFFKSTWS
jgi:hypothetical protein